MPQCPKEVLRQTFHAHQLDVILVLGQNDVRANVLGPGQISTKRQRPKFRGLLINIVGALAERKNYELFQSRSTSIKLHMCKQEFIPNNT